MIYHQTNKSLHKQPEIHKTEKKPTYGKVVTVLFTLITFILIFCWKPINLLKTFLLEEETFFAPRTLDRLGTPSIIGIETSSLYQGSRRITFYQNQSSSLGAHLFNITPPPTALRLKLSFKRFRYGFMHFILGIILLFPWLFIQKNPTLLYYYNPASENSLFADIILE